MFASAPAWGADAGTWSELARVTHLEATFTQTQHRAILKAPLASTGSVAYDRKGPRLTWIVTTPSRSSFVLDGPIARMDYPDLGVSETFDLDQVPGASRLATSMLVWMQADAAAVARDFDATYASDSASLKPKDATLAALLAEIRIRFATAPTRVREVHLLEPDGDRVEIVFTSVVLDGAPVPDP